MVNLMTSEDPSKQIEKNLEQKDARQELFQQRVIIIGELHTQRAVWANKIGQLKSLSITQTNEMAEHFQEKLESLESLMSEISTSITDFSPESIQALKDFKSATEDKFKELEKLYLELENTDAEGAPNKGDESD